MPIELNDLRVLDRPRQCASALRKSGARNPKILARCGEHVVFARHNSDLQHTPRAIANCQTETFCDAMRKKTRVPRQRGTSIATLGSRESGNSRNYAKLGLISVVRGRREKARAAGKSLRGRVPRTSHSEWSLPTRRNDPMDMVLETISAGTSEAPVTAGTFLRRTLPGPA
jgi:hypothetical protein